MHYTLAKCTMASGFYDISYRNSIARKHFISGSLNSGLGAKRSGCSRKTVLLSDSSISTTGDIPLNSFHPCSLISPGKGLPILGYRVDQTYSRKTKNPSLRTPVLRQKLNQRFAATGGSLFTQPHCLPPVAKCSEHCLHACCPAV